jgi:hypothetical protein
MTRRAPLLVCALIAVGCASGGLDRAEPTDQAAEIRRDTAPLTKRFPAVGSPEAVSWVSWNSSSGRAPGPTTYWIDAVVTLQPQTAQQLIDDFRPAAAGKTPTVQPVLRSALPPGPFLTGAALDTAFSTSGWATAAYLDAGRHQLVLSAIDD